MTYVKLLYNREQKCLTSIQSMIAILEIYYTYRKQTDIITDHIAIVMKYQYNIQVISIFFNWQLFSRAFLHSTRAILKSARYEEHCYKNGNWIYMDIFTGESFSSI